jgi:hypothetical protein
MGRAIRPCGLLLGLLVVTAPGCQRVNHEKTYTIEPGEIKSILFDAPRSEQKVTVQVSSPGAPVSVYLVTAADEDAALKAASRGSGPAVLAGKEKAEDISLEAAVPAKTAYAVVLEAHAKKAEAKLRVSGR